MFVEFIQRLATADPLPIDEQLVDIVGRNFEHTCLWYFGQVKRLSEIACRLRDFANLMLGCPDPGRSVMGCVCLAVARLTAMQQNQHAGDGEP